MSVKQVKMLRSPSSLAPFVALMLAGCFTAGSWTAAGSGDEESGTMGLQLTQPSCSDSCVNEVDACENDADCQKLGRCVEENNCSDRACVTACACELKLDEIETDATALFGQATACKIMHCTDCDLVGMEFGGWDALTQCLDLCSFCEAACQEDCMTDYADAAYYAWAACVNQGP